MHRSRPFVRRALATLVPLVAVVGLAACGGDDEDTANAASDPAASADPTSAASEPPSEVEPFTLRIGVVSSARSVGGPIGWGDERGLFVDELAAVGVTDVEVLVFPTGPPLVAALQSDEVDIISTGDVPSITAAAEGLDSRLIQLASSGSDTWLLGRPDGPTDVQGLVGKTVTATPGTSPERFVRGLIEEAGLTDVIPVTNLATPDAITALRAGQVDAIPVTGVQAAGLEADGFPVIAKASDHPGLTSTTTVVARQRFLDEHPGLAAAFAEAWTVVVEDLTADFDAFVEWYAEVDDEPVELVRSVVSPELYPTEPFPAEGLELLESTVTFLVEQGILDEPFSIEEWIWHE